MRVLVVTPWYPTSDDPAGGVFVRDHVAAVVGSVEVVVLHIAGWSEHLRGAWRIDTTSDGVAPVVRVTAARRFPRATRWPQVLAVAFAVRKIVRRGFRPDVIHAHVYTAGWYAVLLGRLLRAPVVVTEHWSKLLDADPEDLVGADRIRARGVYRWADVCIVPTRLLERALLEIQPRAQTTVVPNVVDPAVFQPRGTRHLSVVTTASLTADKGVEQVVRAVARLASRWSALRLHVIGDGPERPMLEQLVNELGIASRVCFHGAVAKSDVADVVARCSAFVLASRFETFSVAVAEALCCGTPVVATRCGGPEELVSSTDGVLVSVDDLDALTQGIDLVVSQPGRFDSRQIAERAAERFSSRVVSEKTLAVYADVLARRAR